MGSPRRCPPWPCKGRCWITLRSLDGHRTYAQVHTHCYEATDLDGLVRVRSYNNFQLTLILACSKMTNEFEFSLAAFHHAHEAYLVPELLKKAYGLSETRYYEVT
jgi:hypothetical protein